MSKECKLKSCPFCGSEGHYRYRGVVDCSNEDCPLCHADFDTKGWNTRADSEDKARLKAFVAKATGKQ